jgi:uncharacterized OsmC-like protein
MSDQLKRAIGNLTDAVKKNPQSANAVFRARTVSEVDGFTTSSTVRGFTVTLDEPAELGGEDTGPNPAEAVLAALGSCQAIVYRAYATALGLRLDRVEIETKGHLDLRGFLNLGPVGAGFNLVTFATRLESPEPPEKLRELARLVQEHCPILDTLRTPVEVNGTLQIVSTPERAAPQAA